LKPSKINPYLKTQILTASPEQLQMILYDGLIRFCSRAKTAIAEKDYEKTYEYISKAQKILLELISALKPDVYPELCQNLGALYNYVYRQLIRANVKKDPSPIDRALEVIEVLRSNWAELMEALRNDPQRAGQRAENLAANLRVVG